MHNLNYFIVQLFYLSKTKKGSPWKHVQSHLILTCFQKWNSSVLVLICSLRCSTFAMFRLMFQHHSVNRNKNKKINGRKVKDTISLLIQFGDKHTCSGGYQAGRKSTSVVLIQKLSVNSSFTLYDLGPTRLDFNLRTPRSEIPSH